MKKTVIDAPYIHNYKDVIVTDMGSIIEVKYLSNYNRVNHIQKLDQNTYLDKATGEVKDFTRSISRGDNLNSFAQSFKHLRELINSNYNPEKPDSLLWLTLTFKDNERDPSVFAHCFDIFWKRMKRYFIELNIEIPKYITCVEPQSRGAWHGHMLLFFSDRAPFISNNEVLEKYWEWGFTSVQRLDNVTNVGAYLTAYLTDIPLDEAQDLALDNDLVFSTHTDITVIQGKTVDKKFIKGGRLHLYPSGMKLYRSSQGLKQPDKYTCQYYQVQDKIKDLECIYERHVEIEDDNFSSIVSTRQYRRNKLNEK